jgi:hypothetical protein
MPMMWTRFYHTEERTMLNLLIALPLLVLLAVSVIAGVDSRWKDGRSSWPAAPHGRDS